MNINRILLKKIAYVRGLIKNTSKFYSTLKLLFMNYHIVMSHVYLKLILLDRYNWHANYFEISMGLFGYA